MNAPDAKTESFDVFLCHNSEDKPIVREIARKLAEKDIKPWLDVEQIRPGTSWQPALEQQIESIKAAAVFVGESGLGPWQDQELRAFLSQFVERGCPVIPVILSSAKTMPKLPLLLRNLHYVDFRVTDVDPLGQLIWGITGEKPAELFRVPDSDKPVTVPESVKGHLLPSHEDRAPASKGRSGASEISQTRLYPPLAKPPDPEQAAQLEILRRRVVEYWVEGVLKHSLYNEVLISLGKRPIDQAVDAPWKYTVEVADAAGSTLLDGRDVSAIYDAMGLLLILGEPGSGKTTTLLDLARTLLERAQDDLKERVPVVLNLSSWKKGQPLAEWISGELTDKYRVHRETGHLWLKHKYLLPLLDGLDEVETRMQPDCVAAINAFISEFNPSGLVVCCRLMEYQWLPERLKLNGAICLEALSPEEVTKYLDRAGPKLAALHEAVNADPVLQELAQTPLMLSIMSLAFQGAGGHELASQKGDSVEERRKQIFCFYVERMFHRRETAFAVFPKEKVINWLSWLAGKMREHSESVFLIEGLQPSWLGTRAQRGIYGIVVALSLALIFVLASGLTSTLTSGPMSGLTSGLTSGPTSGLTSGPIYRTTYALTYGLAILVGVALGCWSKSPLKNGIMSGSISGLISGLIAGLVIVPIFGLSGALGGALSGGLFFGLCSGLSNGLFVGLIGSVGAGSLNHISIVETISWDWNQFWRKTISGLINGVKIGLIVGSIGGLIFGLFLEKDVKSGSQLIFALFFGLIFGLILALFFGLICGCCFGVVTGLIGAFTDRTKVGKASPNQGINLSWKNALAVFLVSWLIVGLVFGLIFGSTFGFTFGSALGLNTKLRGGQGGLIFGPVAGLVAGLIFGLIFGLIIGQSFGLIIGLNRGGSAVIKHYALRLILWRKGYTPFNLIQFLDHCARLILLKKVGGSYIFIHRMLLDYFADRAPSVHYRRP